MDDMDMAMAMAGFQNLEDQVTQYLSMSPTWSSATSSAAVPPPTTTTTTTTTTDDSTATAAATPTTGDEVRRGPWTLDEDILLTNYITVHGSGRWNALARSAGLNRTGKSCRLRWLNYLRPDVRRGSITPAEQLLILDLHSRWGNRWSKIAAHLPGRTDNEVKNYWRTRVQKHARRLRCDVNGDGFRRVVRHVWMPRLREQVQLDKAAAAAGREEDDDLRRRMVAAAAPPAITAASAPTLCWNYYDGDGMVQQQRGGGGGDHHGHGGVPPPASQYQYYSEPAAGQMTAAAAAMSPDDASSALRAPPPSSSHYKAAAAAPTNDGDQGCSSGGTATAAEEDVFAAGTTWSELLATATGGDGDCGSMAMIGGGLQVQDFGFGDLEDGLWSLDDLCLQQLC